MNRTLVTALSVLLLSTAVPGGLVTAHAVEPPTAAPPGLPCAAGAPVRSDFDGDSLADLVVGGRWWNGTASVREQYLLPGAGTPVWWHGTGDLQPADLNGDVCADAILFAGGYEPWVLLVPGTTSGLDLAAAVALAVPQATDASEEEDRSLTFDAVGLRHDGFSQVVLAGRHVWENDNYGAFIDVLTLDSALSVTATQVFSYSGVEGRITGFGPLAASGRSFAVGVPHQSVNGKAAAGAVYLFSADTAEPATMVRRLVLTQNSPGVPGSAESMDRFGSSLAMRDGRLAIGVPGESDGNIRASGLVQPVVWHEASNSYTARRAISQDLAGVPGRNEAQDRFGQTVEIARGLTAAGSWDIAIGANERVGTRNEAGSVTVAGFTGSRFRVYTQRSPGMPGTVEAGDGFASVGVLATSATVDTLLIGAPGEDAGGTANAGYAVRTDGVRLGADTVWTKIGIPADATDGLTSWGLDFGNPAP